MVLALVLALCGEASCHLIFPFDTSERSIDGAVDVGVVEKCTPELCPLGCDEDKRACYVPSNVDSALLSPAFGPLVLDTDVTIDSDSGKITRTSDNSVIPFGGFGRHDQAGGSSVGVLKVSDLTVGPKVTVKLVGAAPLVILAAGEVVINGTIDAGARKNLGGPGGGSGGDPGKDGSGPCGGRAGLSETPEVCPDLCISGSGGGGHGSTGGSGGPVTYDNPSYGTVTLAEGVGGEICGAPAISPLAGGSGGAGGARHAFHSPSTPGPGGGGGGAIQISAIKRIVLGPKAGITVPGDGGGLAKDASGAGGGAGGAILLEAPLLSLETTSFLAANGGGGGAGDCT